MYFCNSAPEQHWHSVTIYFSKRPGTGDLWQFRTVQELADKTRHYITCYNGKRSRYSVALLPPPVLTRKNPIHSHMLLWVRRVLLYPFLVTVLL